MSTYIGIDVGGIRKGFHLAILNCTSSPTFTPVQNFHDPKQVIDCLTGLNSIRAIAVDSPPKAQITGPKTRLAERQINASKVKVQWTRRPDNFPDEWMLNGEKLWKALQQEFPKIAVIETFPTLVSKTLGDCELCLPLSLLKGTAAERKYYCDCIDACLCAYAALKFDRGQSGSFGFCAKTNEIDELGLIYY